MRNDTATDDIDTNHAAKHSQIVQGEPDGQTNINNAVTRRLEYAMDQAEVDTALEADRNTTNTVTPATQSVGFSPFLPGGQSLTRIHSDRNES